MPPLRCIKPITRGRQPPAVGHPHDDGPNGVRPAAVVGCDGAARGEGGGLFGGGSREVAGQGGGGEVEDRAEVGPVALDGGLAFWWVVGEEAGRG